MFNIRLNVIVATVFMVGCATASTRSVTVPSPTREHLFVNNYKLGEMKEAFVGQSVVVAQDYYVTHTLLPLVTATQAATFVTHFLLKCSISAGWASPVTKEAVVNGQAHLVVPLPCGVSLLVKADGTVADQLITAEGMKVSYSPPAVRFVRSERQDIDSQSGFTNFELLYGGTNGTSFSLTYREYTADNLVRPAFTQALTFENSAKSIRFRNLRLAIHEVSSEHLLFTVTSDSER